MLGGPATLTNGVLN